LFSNTTIQLMFPPMPVKIKWLVGIYMVYELYMGFFGQQDGIGHWAHIGGAITGTIFIFAWKQNKNRFY
jgi:membrane associated rhomboid family serine protease